MVESQDWIESGKEGPGRTLSVLEQNFTKYLVAAIEAQVFPVLKIERHSF